MNTLSSVKETPEFASLCSYIQLFGNDLNISLSHNQLEKFLELNNFEGTPVQWLDLHRKLLNRIQVKCINHKWESSMKKYINKTLVLEASLPDLYDKSYFQISPQQRAKLLNIIFDTQFDKNVKFKEKVNLRLNKDLRMQPFGSDIYGCLYWFFIDSEVDIIMYKENLEDESFKIVAESIEDLRNLLGEFEAIDADNIDLSKLYLESVTPEETNSPNNEPESDGLLKLESNVKKEECTVNNYNEMNGNRTPVIEPTDTSFNEERTPISEDVKQEVMIDDNSDNDKILVISSTCPEESPKDNLIDSPKDSPKETPKESESQIDKVDILNTPEKNNDKKVEEKKRRGRKPKPAKTPVKPDEIETTVTEIDSQELNQNLRRSERKRKPVNPFTIMYSPPSSKKSKIVDSQNDNTDLAESESNKKAKKSKTDHVKDHSKPGRPKKMKKHSKKDKESKDKKKLKKESKHKHKAQRNYKQKKPWEDADSSEEHVEEEEEEDFYQHEESEPSPNVKDEDIWNDKPESDFDADKLSVSSDEEMLKSRGRNYFRQKKRLKKEAKEEETVDDTPCQICLGGNLPEMILLCDFCNFGHHAMCLRPSLMLIPEGDWFCPKCQHKKLIENLTTKIQEIDKLLGQHSAKIRMQERLNFVNISMTNILSNNRNKSYRQKSSNDSNSANGDTSSPSMTSSSESDNNSESDGSSSSSGSTKETQGRYKFRESSRKENTRYNFEEINKIFDNALETDEKYQLLKNRQDKDESEEEESEPEYDYSGLEPRKKSSGKDMSNILEEEKPRLRRPTKRKRLTMASDEDDFEDDEKDQDFKLSDELVSDLDEDDDKISENDASDSDELWVSRTRRSTRKSSRRREKKSKKKPRVEYDEGYTRPRRSAARKVNYLEMIGGDEDEDEKDDNDGRKNGRGSPDFESSDDENGCKPPPVLSRKKSKLGNRRRKISDSEYEESKDNSATDSGSTDELDTAVRQKKKRLCMDSETDSGREEDVEEKKETVMEEKDEVKNEVTEGEKEDVEEGKDELNVDPEIMERVKEVLDLGKDVFEGEMNILDTEVFEGVRDAVDLRKVGTDEAVGAESGLRKNEASEALDLRKESVGNVGLESEEYVAPTLAVKNPMRAKANEDMDVENEVESETDEEEEEESSGDEPGLGSVGE